MHTDISIPLLEFDDQSKAILEPKANAELLQNVPDRAVLCFFYDVIADLVAGNKLEKIGGLMSELGPNPIYRMVYENTQIAVMHPGVGAPLSACFLEELIAVGVKKMIAVGGCGVLQAGTDAGHAFVIDSAIRDEGTSYHYLPAEAEAKACPLATQAIIETLVKHAVPHKTVKSWTTDGLYRETVDKRNQRIQQGCHIVEMEASAFFAVAAYRGVSLGQLVYGGDLVVPEGWDPRKWTDRQDDRMNLFHLAVEACARL
jgi:uridine phosphorylase